MSCECDVALERYCTRPDIAQVVGAVSKFNSCPIVAHLTTVKRIFRYLKETINLCIKYERSADDRLVGFSDVNWAGNMNDRHSTTESLLMMHSEKNKLYTGRHSHV